MGIDVVLLDDRRYAVVVLSGRVEPGCGAALTGSLRVCARAHTIVDLRHVTGLTPEAVKALLSALGCALDHRRTLRLVVRDDRQRRFLTGLGLSGMMPLHDTIGEATEAVEAAIAEAARDRKVRQEHSV